MKGRYYHIHPRSLNNELDRKRQDLGGRWLEKTQYGDCLIGPHSFRRSWIVHYLDMFKDPAECARAIGHSDISTTYAYYQEIKKDHLVQFVNCKLV